MSVNTYSNIITFSPTDNRRLAKLCGQFDENLRIFEKYMGVQIKSRGNSFELTGHPEQVEKAKTMLHHFYDETIENGNLTLSKIQMQLHQASMRNGNNTAAHPHDQQHAVKTKNGNISAKNTNQKLYLDNITAHDINFAIGPAGTGKTYLAVAAAVQALESQRVSRIILVRPAVEAGERLGFLPGDLAQKVDPYLRPLYDALYEMLGFERVLKFVERNIIEIAPLAYMRGRTLNDSFIILDESQNTTKEQMKMFLTRLGYGSVAVVNGDITQIDLPRGTLSGLCHALEVLKEVKGISFTYFQSTDIVRHPLIQKIVNAYEKAEKSKRDPT